MGCFKPKQPKVPKPAPDPNYTIQRVAMEQDARDRKAENKAARTEMLLQSMAARYGRGSLFSNGTGGGGFAGTPVATSAVVKG